MSVVGEVHGLGGGFNSWKHKKSNSQHLGFAGRNIVKQQLALQEATKMIGPRSRAQNRRGACSQSDGVNQMLKFRTGEGCDDTSTDLCFTATEPTVTPGQGLHISGICFFDQNGVSIAVDDKERDIRLDIPVTITVPNGQNVTINDEIYADDIAGLTVVDDIDAESISINASLSVKAIEQASYFVVRAPVFIEGTLVCDGNNKSNTDGSASGVISVSDVLTVGEGIIMSNNGLSSVPVSGIDLFKENSEVGKIIAMRGNIVMKYNQGGIASPGIGCGIIRDSSMANGSIQAKNGSIVMAYNVGGDASGELISGGGAAIGGNSANVDIPAGTIEASDALFIYNNRGGNGAVFGSVASGGGAGVGGGGSYADVSTGSSAGRGFILKASSGNICNNSGGLGGQSAGFSGGAGAGFGGGGGAGSSDADVILAAGGNGETYSSSIIIGTNPGESSNGSGARFSAAGGPYTESVS